MTVLELPTPPSVNALYTNVPGKGRRKTTTYRKWIKEAGWLLKAQRPKPIAGEYQLTVLVGPTRADLGNLEKGLSDLLQTHGVIENDRLCQGLTFTRSSEIPKGKVKLWITGRQIKNLPQLHNPQADQVNQAADNSEGQPVTNDNADTWISLGDAATSALDQIVKTIKGEAAE